tara:strand:- start:11010 stop:11780 length:771 start_codon:yes stop_codon:yes gene_type:complete
MPKHIDNLKAAVGNRSGFAKPNRFMIEFPAVKQFLPREQLSDFDLFCESTSLPGRQMLTLDYTSTRHTHKKPNGYQNEDITFVFNITNDYFIKDIFTRWTNEIVNRDTYEVGFKGDYATPVIIHQLDEQDNKVYTVILRDAFPVSLQNIDLNQTTVDSIQKFSVTMTYFDFIEIKGQHGSVNTNPKIQPVPIKRNKNYSANLNQPFDKYIDSTLPNENDVKQKRRKIPTIIPQLPPVVNSINRIARIFGVTDTQPQ